MTRISYFHIIWCCRSIRFDRHHPVSKSDFCFLYWKSICFGININHHSCIFFDFIDSIDQLNNSHSLCWIVNFGIISSYLSSWSGSRYSNMDTDTFCLIKKTIKKIQHIGYLCLWYTNIEISLIVVMMNRSCMHESFFLTSLKKRSHRLWYNRVKFVWHNLIGNSLHITYFGRYCRRCSKRSNSSSDWLGKGNDFDKHKYGVVWLKLDKKYKSSNLWLYDWWYHHLLMIW